MTKNHQNMSVIPECKVRPRAIFFPRKDDRRHTWSQLLNACLIMLSGTGQLDYFDNHTYMYTNYTENCCLQTSCLYNCPRKGLHHFQRRAYLACPAYSVALMLNFPIGFEKCLRTLLFNILVTYTWQNKYTISFNY